MTDNKEESLQPVKRVFKFGTRILQDIDPSLSPEEIMELYSRTYPSLTKGEIAGPYLEDGQANYKIEGKGSAARYDMSPNYGTKG